MAQRQLPRIDPPGAGRCLDRARQCQQRLTSVTAQHLAVMPLQPAIVDEDLGDRLLGRPPRRNGGRAQSFTPTEVDLPCGEDPGDESRAALDDVGEAGRVDDVDTDAPS